MFTSKLNAWQSIKCFLKVLAASERQVLRCSERRVLRCSEFEVRAVLHMDLVLDLGRPNLTPDVAAIQRTRLSLRGGCLVAVKGGCLVVFTPKLNAWQSSKCVLKVLAACSRASRYINVRPGLKLNVSMAESACCLLQGVSMMFGLD